MYLKSAKLYNYKQFEGNNEFVFEKITFIKGPNGIGKSNMALKSLLLCLYGYTGKNSLTDCPTRDKAKSCLVEHLIEHEGSEYKVSRAIPTVITIEKDGEEVEFKENNSLERKVYLQNLFHNTDYFQRFRIIDAYDDKVNFLEKGEGTIKQILFSVQEVLLNQMKAKLNEIKRDREIFNKDKVVVYSHYPSQKRLELLKQKDQELNQQLAGLETTLRNFRMTISSISGTIGDKEGLKNYFRKQITKVLNNTVCPECERPLEETLKNDLINRKNEKIGVLDSEINIAIEKRKIQEEAMNYTNSIVQQIHSKKMKIQNLTTKLSSRLQQKDYIYTEKDILIVKKAIQELSLFSSFYLKETVKVLEPIINSVLEKINHRLEFDLNDKGKFAINLYDQNDTKWNYNDLSSGQKLMLQIAFKLALLLERGEEGLIIADEGLGSLDRGNLLHIIELFNKLPFQLIFILHNFDNLPGNVKIIDLNNLKEE